MTTTNPTFLFCRLPHGDRMPLDEYMKPLLERLPEDQRDILSELPTDPACGHLTWREDPYFSETAIQHSLLCKLGCKCTCPTIVKKVSRAYKQFRLCNKQLNDGRTEWIDNRCYLRWNDILLDIESAFDSERSLLDGIVTLWVPIGGDMYEYSSHRMKVLERDDSGVVQCYTEGTRQGLGRIVWEGEGNSRARLLRVQ